MLTNLLNPQAYQLLLLKIQNSKFKVVLITDGRMIHLLNHRISIVQFCIMASLVEFRPIQFD